MGFAPTRVPTKLFLEYMGGVFEGLVYLAPREGTIHHQIGSLVLLDKWAVGRYRLEGICDGFERLVFDLNGFESILGEGTTRCRDGRHRFADKANFACGETMSPPSVRRGGGGIAPAQRVVTGDDCSDAGQRFGGLGVDPLDSRSGKWASQNRAMQHARKFDVVQKLDPTGQQQGIFLAAYAAPYEAPVFGGEFFEFSGNLDRHVKRSRPSRRLHGLRPAWRPQTGPREGFPGSPCIGRSDRRARPGFLLRWGWCWH